MAKLEMENLYSLILFGEGTFLFDNSVINEFSTS
jgi:hypothetical protein